MQVDPIKHTLKAPGTKRLQLKYDKPLSFFAFNFNLRRYNKHGDVDYEAISKIGENFNAADMRNVCTEAGMFAIRDERDYVVHDDFMKVRTPSILPLEPLVNRRITSL